jgi:hypothetical protein
MSNAPPCIRNLEKFKDGCPERPWNGRDGCPAWIEMPVATQGNPLQKEVRRQCIDLWNTQFNWAQLGVMEGNQQATEGARNMIALNCLVTTNTKSPEELVRVATNNLNKSKKKLLEYAEGKTTHLDGDTSGEDNANS